MTQYEFIQELEDALSGQVSPVVIKYNVDYYSEYIREQLAAGKTSEEVFALLGSPRMIAKTIISAEEAKEGIYEEYEDAPKKKGNQVPKSFMDLITGPWYFKLIAIVAVFLVIYVVLAVVAAAVRVLFWPVVILIVVYFLWKTFSKKGGGGV